MTQKEFRLFERMRRTIKKLKKDNALLRMQLPKEKTVLKKEVYQKPIEVQDKNEFVETIKFPWKTREYFEQKI